MYSASSGNRVQDWQDEDASANFSFDMVFDLATSLASSEICKEAFQTVGWGGDSVLEKRDGGRGMIRISREAQRVAFGDV